MVEEEEEGERKSAQTKFYDRSKFSRSKTNRNDGQMSQLSGATGKRNSDFGNNAMYFVNVFNSEALSTSKNNFIIFRRNLNYQPKS